MTNEVISTFVETRWGRMHVRRCGSGDGPPVVCVHGLGVSGTYFMRAAPLLANGREVLVPDLPGSGRSAKPRHVLNCAEQADVLAEWLRKSGVREAHLVGNSVGCQVAASLAARYPGLAASVILIGPTVERGAGGIMRQFGRLTVDATREPFSEVLLALGDYWRFGPYRFVRTFLHARADRIEANLGRIVVPTLIVRGARDPIVPQNWVEELVRLLPRGELVTIADSAHTVHYSHPQLFAEVAREFWLRVGGGMAEDDGESYRTG